MAAFKAEGLASRAAIISGTKNAGAELRSEKAVDQRDKSKDVNAIEEQPHLHN